MTPAASLRARAAGSRCRVALLCVLTALLWLAPSGARAERVGVVVVSTVNTQSDEGLRLSEALGKALRERLVVDVVAGGEAQRLLPQGGVAEACMVESACQQQLAERLEVEVLLLLTVVRVGARVQIEVTWVDVLRERTAARAPLQIADDGPPAAEVFAEAALELMPEALSRAVVTTDSRARADRADAAAGAESDRADASAARKSDGLARPAQRQEARAAATLLAGSGGAGEDVGSRRRMSPAAWIVGGIGAAALVSGGAFAVDAALRYRDLDMRDCNRMACAPGDIDAVDQRALAADVLIGVGVVATATAAALYWTSDAAPASAGRARAERAPGAALHLSPEAWTVTWSGAF
ncbi:hypothetical protein [Haliangium ochraceum]|uniref:Uncharacterized protein n=1 Tax=Haliangium ochraceum (strain DSM 14365 / JCM 11303 / SMP-2) TaxID=502025 RepID=D0LWB2_HALO1|nr:hypothetical protein [Haliangium ochraceum]ACY16044.1 hypothetical protein Hoch_3542 [Haliangium ochraceum DSM 14365]